jgi:nucleoid-associated protein YgaU
MNEKPVSKSPQGSPKMQQIERYGVIALVFLLVTIVAVSFWGDSKSPGFWSRLTGKGDAKKQVAEMPAPTDPLVVDKLADPTVPITPTTLTPTPAEGGPLVDGNTPSVVDVPTTGTGTLGGTPTNPFVPAPGTTPVPPVTPPGTLTLTPPVASGTVPYTIQSGDSLALIAKRQLGAESRWTEIQNANPGLDPKRLKLGATIQLPAGAAPAPTKSPIAKAATKVPAKAKPAAAPKSDTSVASTRTYKIKKGDLLRSIARTQLGDENRWKEIQAMNPGLDPTKLAVGSTIKLPGGAAKHSSPAPSSKSDSGTVLAALDKKPRVK